MHALWSALAPTKTATRRRTAIPLWFPVSIYHSVLKAELKQAHVGHVKPPVSHSVSIRRFKMHVDTVRTCISFFSLFLEENRNLTHSVSLHCLLHFPVFSC